MGTEQLINTLHTCFIAFLIITILFLVISVILFFALDIRNVFNHLTGRAVKKTIAQMQEANNSTGRLRKVNKMAMGEMTPISVTDDLVADSVTERLQEDSTDKTEGSEETSHLNDGGQYTTLLNAGETSVLNQEMAYECQATGQNVTIGTFVVTKKEMFIHTDEIV